METVFDLRRRSFWERVELAANGCWEWRGGTRDNGYGSFAVRKPDGIWTQTTAHRWAYVDQGGTIPPEWEVDHLCRNRSCVRTEHLEAVTLQENRRRRDIGYAPDIPRDLRPVPSFGPLPPIHGPERRDPELWCLNGHEYAVVGWRTNGKNRQCSGCYVDRLAANRKGGAHGTETHCPQGHGYTPENTYTRKRGGRECKKCTLDRNREAARRRAAAKRAA